MRSDHDRVEARAEVVDVGDGDVLDPAVAEHVERARAPDRREEVAVPGRVERRPAVLEEQVAALGEPERHGLREPERLRDLERCDVGARLVRRLEARHQRDGDLDAERVAEPRGLAELPREEAPAVDRLDGALHDTAEARRHPACEHDLSHTARREGVETGRARRRQVVRAKLGERRHVALGRRLHDAPGDVRRRRQLAGGHARAERFERLRVEPEAVEDATRLGIDVLQDHRAAAVSRGSDAVYGVRWMPRSVTIAATRSPGVTSKAGLRAAKRVVSSDPSRSSIGISSPAARDGSSVERRRDDDERQPVVRREDGETVRPDLVRRVAVGGDPVGARHHEVDLAAGHERRRRPVRDHGMRDGELLELPRREAAALQERPRLVDPDVRDATGLVRGADCSERRAVPTRREPARVAVREDARALREQLHRVRAHRAAALDLVGVDPLGSLARRLVAASPRAPSGG